jgi:hypothetical protein
MPPLSCQRDLGIENLAATADLLCPMHGFIHESRGIIWRRAVGPRPLQLRRHAAPDVPIRHAPKRIPSRGPARIDINDTDEEAGMLVQSRIATLKPHPEPFATHLPIDPEVALFQLAGDVEGERVVVIGAQALDLLCSVLRRGAAEATLLRPGVRPDKASFDLAIIAEATGFEATIAAIVMARRALTDSGRIVLRLAADPARPLIALAVRTLQKCGLSGIRILTTSDHALLVGELPWFRSHGHA